MAGRRGPWEEPRTPYRGWPEERAVEEPRTPYRGWPEGEGCGKSQGHRTVDGRKERAVGRAKDTVPWMAGRRGLWEEPRTPYRGWPEGEGRGKRKRSAIFL